MNIKDDYKQTRYVMALSQINKDDTSIVGGKAANLGKLISAGFQVPEGFCITTESYYRTVKTVQIDEFINELMNLQIDDIDKIKEISMKIRLCISEVNIPENIKKNIIYHYNNMKENNTAVSVRSSATAEDLEDASFAGQQDTFLNVIGIDELLKSVKKCWTSLWNYRAVIYRMKNKIDQKTAKIAIVVQKLVDASLAGVLFTANPITGKRAETVIDANFGLGESVVSGMTTPDNFVINNITGEIIKKTINNNKTVIKAGLNGGTEKINIENKHNKGCMDMTNIKKLVHIGNNIQDYYGIPQDIEWAINGRGNIWILQSRAITTLYPLPKSIDGRDEDLRVYLSATSDEGVTQPITPMGLEAYRLLAIGVMESIWNIKTKNIAVDAGCRFYYDITPILRNKTGRKFLEALIATSDNYTAGIWNTMKDDRRLVARKSSYWKIFKVVTAFILKTKFVPYTIRAFWNPVRARIKVENKFHSIVHNNYEDESSSENMLKQSVNLMKDFACQLPVIGFTEMTAGYIAFEIAKKILKNTASPEELQIVLGGLPNNPTTEMNIALWIASKKIKCDENSVEALNNMKPESLCSAYLNNELPSILKSELDKFLEVYGYRAVSEIDLGLPRWKERPQYIFGVLSNYIKLDDTKKAPDYLFLKSRHEGENMLGKLVERERKKGTLRALIVKWLLNRARTLIGRREVWKTQLSFIYDKIRKKLLLIGDELVNRKLMNNREDIFFADISEIKEGISGKDLRPIVKSARYKYNNEINRKMVPTIMLSDGTIPHPKILHNKKDNSLLCGIGASPGIIRGHAKIILNPQGARVEPGEILITPSADPGWTPLFLTAGGLVMERGGVISHGAVVAREYGIPAVVGALGVLDKIKTGDMITVNGFDGTVDIEK